MISETGSVEAMLRTPGFPPFAPSMDHSRLDRLDPMQNQLCRVCEEPAAGFHFGAFTCEGCKSFFGRTCNNQSVIQECKNNYRCVVDKKNRTACKACRLRKCLMVGMSKSGSRYGRRSNWFKIHCLMQQNLNGSPGEKSSPPSSSTSTSSLSPTAPQTIWPYPHKTELKEERNLSPPAAPASPEAPTMVPRTSLADSSTSPFKSLLSKPPTPEVLSAPPPPPITSLYSGFPSPLSLMSAAAPGAAFPGIPFHKQALLSPLLAQSHLWQLAAASRHPLLSSIRPELDLLAEHKALMERFAQKTTMDDDIKAASVKSESPEPKTPEPLQHIPMDLSSSKKEEEETKRKEGKDLNKNNIVSVDNILGLCSKSS